MKTRYYSSALTLSLVLFCAPVVAEVLYRSDDWIVHKSTQSTLPKLVNGKLVSDSIQACNLWFLTSEPAASASDTRGVFLSLSAADWSVMFRDPENNLPNLPMEQAVVSVSGAPAFQYHALVQGSMITLAGNIHDSFQATAAFIRDAMLRGESMSVSLPRLNGNNTWTYTPSSYDGEAGATFSACMQSLG